MCQRARGEGEEGEENIGDPAGDSQTGSSMTVGAMKQVQNADQSHRYTGTEEPEPEQGRSCRKPKGREHVEAAQGDYRPADECIQTVQDAHTLVFGPNETQDGRPLARHGG